MNQFLKRHHQFLKRKLSTRPRHVFLPLCRSPLTTQLFSQDRSLGSRSNPKWAFEEEPSFGKELGSFAGSFEVIYSFMGLEVKGILSRRKGVVFRSVKDGVLSGEEWLVFVQDEENNGQLKVVSRFNKRPAIGDVESVLYNLMAANSPMTKSVKFLRQFGLEFDRKETKPVVFFSLATIFFLHLFFWIIIYNLFFRKISDFKDQ